MLAEQHHSNIAQINKNFYTSEKGIQSLVGLFSILYNLFFEAKTFEHLASLKNFSLYFGAFSVEKKL